MLSFYMLPYRGCPDVLWKVSRYRTKKYLIKGKVLDKSRIKNNLEKNAIFIDKKWIIPYNVNVDMKNVSLLDNTTEKL